METIEIKPLRRFCYYCGKGMDFKPEDRQRCFCSDECADRHSRESAIWRMQRRLMGIRVNKASSSNPPDHEQRSE